MQRPLVSSSSTRKSQLPSKKASRAKGAHIKKKVKGAAATTINIWETDPGLGNRPTGRQFRASTGSGSVASAAPDKDHQSGGSPCSGPTHARDRGVSLLDRRGSPAQKLDILGYFAPWRLVASGGDAADRTGRRRRPECLL